MPVSDRPTLRPSAAAFVLALLLALLPPPAAAGLFDPTTFTLENGLEVVVVEDHRAPVVAHQVWYRVGAADEPPGKSGIAHFLEHLMFKGTATLAPGEFSRIMARNGAQENASTSQDFTNYYQLVASDKLELVMRLEADRMANLRLAEEDVATELQVILEERRQRIDSSPRALLSEQARAAQYLRHPYRIPVIGWEAEMRGLTRADAVAFYERHYAPNNAILIVAGDVDPAEVRRLAERYYGPLSRRDVPPRQRDGEPAQLAERRLTMEDARVRQATWQRTYLAPSRRGELAPQAMALSVLDYILGGGPTSRLQRSLVIERRLAASAGSSYSSLSWDDTLFYFYATPAEGVELAELEAAIDGELDKLLKEGVTAEEVARAVAALRASAVYARDNLTTAPNLIGAALTAGLTVAQLESWPDDIAKVTPDDVLRAAEAVLERRRSVTAILLPKKPAG